MTWWARESTRQLLALPPALLAVLVPGESLVKSLAGWDIYAGVYLTLTWLAYRRHGPSRLKEIALASRRGRPLADRLFTTAPEQLSHVAASFALNTTVIAMPRARELGTSPGLVLGICVAAVLTCWVMLQVGFALEYLGLYAERGGLEFPGDTEPDMTDFLYFAFGIGTSFGTTDVTITQRRVRRQVAVHGVLAFFFNTLVVAVAITILTSYLAP